MDRLFQETSIKSLILKNRFVRSATWMGLADPEGGCTQELIKYYETLAEGNVGLIISGFAFVSREGQGQVGQLGAYSDKLLPGLGELTARVHKKGGKIVAQLVHCGVHSNPEFNGGAEAKGPCELKKEEIHRIIEDYGKAAVRMKEAGFDGIQLHYAHGYLGSQFLGPRTNDRTDEYGGSIDNRSRFLCETLTTVRDAVGEEFPVMAKLNLADYIENGLVFEDGLFVAAKLNHLGVDCIEVSGGVRDSKDMGPARKLRTDADQAYFLDNARVVKSALGLPVMLVGGLRDPKSLDKIHQETGIDYFSLSRPLIRNPLLVNRWMGGDPTPSSCVSCSGCFLSIKKGKGVYCIKKRKNKKDL